MRKTLLRRCNGPEPRGGPWAFALHAIVFESEAGPATEVGIETVRSLARCEAFAGCNVESSRLVRECTTQWLQAVSESVESKASPFTTSNS